jgi:hypothetical protein
LNEHWRVVDEDGLGWGGLGKVESKPEDLDVRLPHPNKAGRDEGIHNPVELEGANAVCIDLTRFIANDDDLQPELNLELGYKFNHLWIRLRLSKHEVTKLIPGKRSLLIEHHPSQIFIEGELPFLVGLEDEAMTLIHFRPIQHEVFRRSSARVMVPPVGEQDPAYIHKQRRDWERLFHFSFGQLVRKALLAVTEAGEHVRHRNEPHFCSRDRESYLVKSEWASS